MQAELLPASPIKTSLAEIHPCCGKGCDRWAEWFVESAGVLTAWCERCLKKR